MKYFVISDIHSYYDEMIEALTLSGFELDNPTHIILALGDYWDRGNEPVNVMEFLLNLYDKSRAILIRGNHEDLLENVLKHERTTYADLHNGTTLTIELLGNYASTPKNEKRNQYQKIKKNKTITRFLNASIDYYEKGNYIFTHGFIPTSSICGYKVYDEKWRTRDRYAWEDARFDNGIALAEEYHIHEKGKIIVVGHMHASYGNIRKKYGFDIDDEKAFQLSFQDKKDFEPYFGTNIIGIDACVPFSKHINCLVFEEKDDSFVLESYYAWAERK